MTYSHLTMDEISMLETYFTQGLKVSDMCQRLKRAKQTIYNVINAFKEGLTAIDYYQRYKRNKSRCGRKQISLPKDQTSYIQHKVNQGWSPDAILGRKEKHVNCSVKTLYRMFHRGTFPTKKLAMKGKRKPNHHKERRGRHRFLRNISTRKDEFEHFDKEFGHFEGDTIVGRHHQSAIITLVERQTKFAITLKPQGRTARDIQESLDEMLEACPRNLFKSITFDCGKEFSNWKAISNKHDISIFFADPGTPSQRGLNKHTNGLFKTPWST